MLREKQKTCKVSKNLPSTYFCSGSLKKKTELYPKKWECKWRDNVVRFREA
jgi:hypothetical protein